MMEEEVDERELEVTERRGQGEEKVKDRNGTDRNGQNLKSIQVLFVQHSSSTGQLNVLSSENIENIVNDIEDLYPTHTKDMVL